MTRDNVIHRIIHRRPSSVRFRYIKWCVYSHARSLQNQNKPLRAARKLLDCFGLKNKRPPQWDEFFRGRFRKKMLNSFFFTCIRGHVLEGIIYANLSTRTNACFCSMSLIMLQAARKYISMERLFFFSIFFTDEAVHMIGLSGHHQ